MHGVPSVSVPYLCTVLAANRSQSGFHLKRSSTSRVHLRPAVRARALTLIWVLERVEHGTTVGA